MEQKQPANFMVKLYINENHIRRFQIQHDTTLTDVQEIVQKYCTEERNQLQDQISHKKKQKSQLLEKFNKIIQEPNNIHLQYEDDEGEWISLSTEEEWNVAKVILAQQNQMKLRVANFWQQTAYTVKRQRQQIMHNLNKEKRELRRIGDKIYRDINKELNKIGSSSELQHLQDTIQGYMDTIYNKLEYPTTDQQTVSTPQEQHEEQEHEQYQQQPQEEEQEESIQDDQPQEQQTDTDHLTHQQFHEQPKQQQQQQQQQQHQGYTPYQSLYPQQEGMQPYLQEQNKTQTTSEVHYPSQEMHSQDLTQYFQPQQVQTEAPTQQQAHEENQTETIFDEESTQQQNINNNTRLQTNYPDKLEHLQGMGFPDTEKNIELLEKYNGDMNQVIDILMS